MKYFLTLILCIPWLAACASTADPAINAQRDAAATQLAILAGTATAEMAELRTTADYVSTRASLAATRGAFLELTLVARGTPQEVIRQFQSSMMASLVTLTPTPAPALVIEADVASGQPEIIVTPLALPTPEALPTADPDAPQYADIVTATGVGNDDCALNITSEFTPQSSAIYVVARARNIAPGTQLSSQWTANGQPVVSYDFTPNFEIRDACIWFFVTPSEVAFTAGEWSVQLAINGVPNGSPARFTIRDAGGG
ncbi:hypothetical protein VZO05_01790 [Aggregatilineales bacterium SYSU G02658]